MALTYVQHVAQCLIGSEQLTNVSNYERLSLNVKLLLFTQASWPFEQHFPEKHA